MKATDEEAIRDQLVDTMREELRHCPDPVVYCVEPQFEEIYVEWGPGCPDGVVLRTERGVFQVKVSVTKQE